MSDTLTLDDTERFAVESNLTDLSKKAINDAVTAAILVLELDADSASDEVDLAYKGEQVRDLGARIEAEIKAGTLTPRADTRVASASLTELPGIDLDEEGTDSPE